MDSIFSTSESALAPKTKKEAFRPESIELPPPPSSRKNQTASDNAHAESMVLWNKECEAKIRSARRQHNKQFNLKVLEWEAECKAVSKLNDELCSEAEQAMKPSFLSGEPDIIEKIFFEILRAATLSELLCSDPVIAFDRSNSILLVEILIVSPEKLPDAEDRDYLEGSKPRKLSIKERRQLYQEFCAQIALATLHCMFSFNSKSPVLAIALNVRADCVHPGTGRPQKPCILSMLVSKEDWKRINLKHVTPTECVRHLGAISGNTLADLTPVPPVLQYSASDKRFISGREIETHETTNLAAMPWEDFEHLVRNLFEKEFATKGATVRITRTSRDGGVDAIVYDPAPIHGGKILIQAKRYTNVVGVSAVRDLAGAVDHERANKGILVSTSSYGKDAYDFAKDKPLVLINGQNLLHLLERNGISAHIDIATAKAQQNKAKPQQ